KKYKPVAKKVRPVVAPLPEEYRIVREIKGDPLEHKPILPTNPPRMETRGRYTEERAKVLEQKHSDFLQPEEVKLMHSFMAAHNTGFAWSESERGRFREDFFPP
ncbi:hypothetical protein K474DRAFT_1566714, partial [Panus rudis PR-1116 ss-1]